MRVQSFTIPKYEKASFILQEEKLPGFYPFLHRHPEIQICWIRKGKGTLIVEANLYPFEEGAVFIISSNKAHLFKNESSESVQTLTLFFDPEVHNNTLMALPEMKDIQLHFSNLAACHQIDHSITKALLQIKETSRTMALSHFIKLLESLRMQTKVSHKYNYAASGISSTRMKTVIEYAIHNFQNPIDIKKIAAQIHYTPEAFCRFFKKSSGKTFVQYLNEVRIHEACLRINDAEPLLISDIAYQCGFNSVSHFNRVFKHLKKMPPLQYRKTIQT